MTTTCLAFPTATTPDSIRSEQPSLGRRLARIAPSLGRRLVDHRSSPTIAEQVLSEIDLPADFRR